jgi:hypothetical protein
MMHIGLYREGADIKKEKRRRRKGKEKEKEKYIYNSR